MKKKNEIIPVTDEENKFYEEQKSASYVKKDLILVITKSIIKSEIVVITQENLEELLIVFAI